MTNLAKRDDSLRALLDSPAVAERVQEVLGDKGPQFCASVVSLAQADRYLQKCEPKTVLGAAMTAALLDLPINKDLGFAWVIPYGGRAQFQLGYKGYIQLALRTGQYARMNATAVNAEAYKGLDMFGEAIIDWEALDRTQPPIGYWFGFELVNGFKKSIYWTNDEALAHGKRYSQAFRKGKDSPWLTHPAQMALKTVVKHGLSRWGILSVEMQRAITFDQAVIDEELIPDYIDGVALEGGTTETKALTDKYSAPAKKKSKKKAEKKKPAPEPEAKKPEPEAKEAEPAPEPSALSAFEDWLEKNDLTLEDGIDAAEEIFGETSLGDLAQDELAFLQNQMEIQLAKNKLST